MSILEGAWTDGLLYLAGPLGQSRRHSHASLASPRRGNLAPLRDYKGAACGRWEHGDG
jgi:hypothetical protein